MYKKALAFIMCIAAAAACMTSCGNVSQNGEGSSSSSAVTSETESVEIANFTAPKEGDTIITMNIKDYGEVKFRLFSEYAEKGCENFIELAKKGYYDGLTFHRVIKDFMIQGGDPNGNGTGGESVWGGKFDGGTDPHLIHAAGALAYANSGSTATDGSQFYVVTGEVYSEDELAALEGNGYTFTEQQKKIYSTAGGAPWLDGSYTVFGQVIDGLDVIFKVQETATGANDMPENDIIIESVKVGEYKGEEIRWYISDYDYEPATEAETEATTQQQNVEAANFTAPKEGETIVTMKLEGYDQPVKFKLFPEYAEKGVENFIELAKSGYYNGLTFHRVIKDFMIQGGDPEGNGMGGESTWGGSFDGGTDPHLIHAAGALAYANSGSTATNGSQFYIVTGEVYSDSEIDELQSYGYGLSDSQIDIYSTAGGVPWLDGGYTVFGQVFDGLDVVFDISKVDTDDNDKPTKDVIIETMTVEEYSGEPVRFYITDYDGTAASETDTDAEESSDTQNEEETSSDEETTTEETSTDPEQETTTAE